MQVEAVADLSLQGVTAASSGTHTRWWEEQASSLALSRAPAGGVRRLPEGSRRDTGGGLRDVYTVSNLC